MNFMQMRCPYCLAVTTRLGPLLVGFILHEAMVAHSLVFFFLFTDSLLIFLSIYLDTRCVLEFIYVLLYHLKCNL